MYLYLRLCLSYLPIYLIYLPTYLSLPMSTLMSFISPLLPLFWNFRFSSIYLWVRLSSFDSEFGHLFFKLLVRSLRITDYRTLQLYLYPDFCPSNQLSTESPMKYRVSEVMGWETSVRRRRGKGQRLRTSKQKTFRVQRLDSLRFV